MKITVCSTPKLLGTYAAQETAAVVREAIAKNGVARILLSTGASQFDTFDGLLNSDIDFSKVEAFHLDEYVGLPITHPASFRKYLTERFATKVNLKAFHFVDGTKEGIKTLTEEIRKSPIDVGLIGIGENAHIAFNDPPADFNNKDAYIIVDLDDACKRQQVGEGWFATIDDVPKQAVSMSCYQIMQCKKIISCVPYAVKANAVRSTLLAKELTNMIPATLLKTHADFNLYVDSESIGDLTEAQVKEVNGNLSSYRVLNA